MHSKTFILYSDKCSLRCKLAEGVLLSLVRAELGMKVCSPKSRSVESVARAMREKHMGKIPGLQEVFYPF